MTNERTASTLILRTATKPVTGILLLFALFMLLRGHDHPGGGFIGGLVAGAAFGLYAMTHGTTATRNLIRLNPRTVVAIGLLFATGTGLLALTASQGYLTHYWSGQTLPVLGGVKLGTTLLFDLGVFLVVTGMVLTVLLRELEET